MGMLGKRHVFKKYGCGYGLGVTFIEKGIVHENNCKWNISEYLLIIYMYIYQIIIDSNIVRSCYKNSNRTRYEIFYCKYVYLKSSPPVSERRKQTHYITQTERYSQDLETILTLPNYCMFKIKWKMIIYVSIYLSG